MRSAISASTSRAAIRRSSFCSPIRRKVLAEKALDGEIRDGRHYMTVRVYYEDTDFSGIVYHASYLRFMERGRTNYLRLLGASQRALFQEAANEALGFAFVVRSMNIEFLKPARMDDLLVVITAPHEVKGASMTLQQEVLRGDDRLAQARVRVAFVAGGRARPIPKPLRTLMKADCADIPG
ncbi:MAG: tol-pal system-associated acyl-CoA thioesterase [Bradyrhizobiaceae bacterium]|nr:tol-pal system-associated acyl-CoA thioesterase [Bradyrhizobiaceae bacterium]